MACEKMVKEAEAFLDPGQEQGHSLDRTPLGDILTEEVDLEHTAQDQEVDRAVAVKVLVIVIPMGRLILKSNITAITGRIQADMVTKGKNHVLVPTANQETIQILRNIDMTKVITDIGMKDPNHLTDRIKASITVVDVLGTADTGTDYCVLG